jgi:hypothetical protein
MVKLQLQVYNIDELTEASSPTTWSRPSIAADLKKLHSLGRGSAALAKLLAGFIAVF